MSSNIQSLSLSLSLYIYIYIYIIVILCAILFKNLTTQLWNEKIYDRTRTWESNSRCQTNRTVFLVRRQIFMSTKTSSFFCSWTSLTEVECPKGETWLSDILLRATVFHSGQHTLKPKTKEIVFRRKCPQRWEGSRPTHLEKMGDGWRGSQDVGGGVQAVPVEEAEWPCGREPLHRAVVVDLCDVCLCGLCLPFFSSQNPRVVHGTVPPLLLALMFWQMTASLHPGDCMILA